MKQATVRRRTKRGVILLLVLLLSGAAWRGDDLLYNTGKAVDLFGSIYRHLMTSYVDRLDPVRLLRAGIDGMLSTVDPYTAFVEDRSKGELDLLTSGTYGGIGINVVFVNQRYIVSEIHPSAVEAEGVRIGDVLLEVDSVSLTDGRVRELKYHLRGIAGSEVRLLVARPGIDTPIELRLERHDVEVQSIQYHTRMDSDILYVRVNRFTRLAGQDVMDILVHANMDKPLQGLILDLRDNPGGLLESAVDLTEKLLPRGSLIVSTRGRQPNYSRRYYSAEDPVDKDIPLVVLVNGHSASASEIVAGAIQDHDRGIILGSKTFGKGLVQSVIPLNYDASLKLTTSKYYVPSGRCIQSERFDSTAGTSIVPPSTRTATPVFRTLNLNRVVYEAGGITPDVYLDIDSLPEYPTRIRDNAAILRFVSWYLNTHPGGEYNGVSTDIQASFRTFVDSLLPPSEGELYTNYELLVHAAERAPLQPTVRADILALRDGISRSGGVLVDAHWHWIEKELNREFIQHIFGQQQELASSLAHDAQVQKAMQLLSTPSLYKAALRSNAEE